MEIEELQCVAAVVKYKTFLEAAENLNRSQSAVSKSIQKLEQELGIRIFERTTRRVRLTTAGEEMLPKMEEILEAWENIRKTAAYHKTLDTGSLRVGSIYFGKENRLVPLIAEFMARHPQMEVNMEESTTTPLLKALDSRELDVIFVSSMYLKEGAHRNYSEDPRYISASFSIDPYFVIVSKRNPLSRRPMLTYRDLEGQSLITTDRTMDVYHTAIRSTFEQYGVKNITVKTHCTNIRSVLHMVSQNIGIAILSKLVVEELEDQVMVPLENPLIRDTQMVILRQKNISPQISTFYKFILERNKSV